jgi:hypothetical protein
MASFDRMIKLRLNDAGIKTFGTEQSSDPRTELYRDQDVAPDRDQDVAPEPQVTRRRATLHVYPVAISPKS